MDSLRLIARSLSRKDVFLIVVLNLDVKFCHLSWTATLKTRLPHKSNTALICIALSSFSVLNGCPFHICLSVFVKLGDVAFVTIDRHKNGGVEGLFTQKYCSYWIKDPCYWNSNERTVTEACLFFFLVWLLLPSKFLIISMTGCFCHDYKGFPFTPYVLSVVKVLAHLRHLYLKNPRFWAISSLKLVLLKFTQRVGRRILLNLWRRWDLSFRGSEVQVVYSTRNTMITSSKHFSVFF